MYHYVLYVLFFLWSPLPNVFFPKSEKVSWKPFSTVSTSRDLNLVPIHHQRRNMKRRDSLRHLHGTGRVSAMRNKFPHPRSEKRAHIWDVVRNVTKVSRKKPVKKKGIPQALPSMTKSPSLEILRQRKRSSSRDRALSGSSDEFLVPPKSPPRTPRRRGSVLKLMLKSHVKQALSRRSIVTSLRQDDEDEYRRLLIWMHEKS